MDFLSQLAIITDSEQQQQQHTKQEVSIEYWIERELNT